MWIIQVFFKIKYEKSPQIPHMTLDIEFKNLFMHILTMLKNLAEKNYSLPIKSY